MDVQRQRRSFLGLGTRHERKAMQNASLLVRGLFVSAFFLSCALVLVS